MRTKFYFGLIPPVFALVILILSSLFVKADTNILIGNMSLTEKESQSNSNLDETNSQLSKFSGTASISGKPPLVPTSEKPSISETGQNNPASSFDKELKHFEKDNESRGYTDLFINWTVAIFGILAVVFALFVLLLGFKGWSEYTKLFEKIDSEVENKLNTEVTKRADAFFRDKLEPKLTAMFSEKQIETIQLLNTTVADDLDRAKKKLSDEIRNLMSKDDLSRQVVDLAVAEVSRRLAPPSPPSNQSEFEPNGGQK